MLRDWQAFVLEILQSQLQSVDKQCAAIFTSELDLLRLTYGVASRGNVTMCKKITVQIREASTNVWLERTPIFYRYKVVITLLAMWPAGGTFFSSF